MTHSGGEMPPNPLDPQEALRRPPEECSTELAHPDRKPSEQDSAVTRAEAAERNHGRDDDHEGVPAKRIKLDAAENELSGGPRVTVSERQKGVAPIKAESVFRTGFVCHRGVLLIRLL